MADISDFGFENDIEFTKHLIREIGVAGRARLVVLRASRNGFADGAILFLQDG
jgi:hypothetical protein